MPYRSKNERERPLWMTLGEAIQHVLEVDGCNRFQALSEMRWEREIFRLAGRPIRNRHFQTFSQLDFRRCSLPTLYQLTLCIGAGCLFYLMLTA
jgi:hypothetical protein